MKQVVSSIKKAMGNLILSGKSEPKKLKIPKIKMKNIWSKHSGKFSTTLQAALNQSVHSTMYEYDEPIFTALKEPHDPFPDDSLLAVNRDFAIKNWGWQPQKLDLYRVICKLGLTYEMLRKIARVRYFGCTLNKNQKDSTATKAIAEALEPLAKLGYIKGSLLSLGKIRLMDSQDSDVSSQKVIMCYVAITDLGEAYLKANPTTLEFLEGGMPNKL